MAGFRRRHDARRPDDDQRDRNAAPLLAPPLAGSTLRAMAAGSTIVVGGGIIGLCCALELGRAGVRTTLLDGAPDARESSWAAAGMLAPHHEAESDTPLWRLCAAGIDAWPKLLASLALAPEEVDWRDAGGWIRSDSAAELDRIEASLRWLRIAGVEVLRLSPAAYARACPGVAPGAGALWLPGAQIDPRRVLTPLADACAAAGVTVRYGAGVQAIGDNGVRLADGSWLTADEVVLASGAWTPALAALAGLDLPGAPVHGQMVRLATPGVQLPGYVREGHRYLLTRRGCTVVGATMREIGFDRTSDPAAVEELGAWAGAVVPALRGAAIAEAWTGLRPRLATGLPVIGRVRPGLLVATGHFRNGILLAPLTGRLVADQVLGHPIDTAFDRFAPPG
jgi:glycine oxidase